MSFAPPYILLDTIKPQKYHILVCAGFGRETRVTQATQNEKISTIEMQQ